MAPDLPLDRLQRWMQSVVVHPGSVDEGLRDPAAAEHVDPERLAEVILPSRTLPPAQRLAIYQNMYPLRMEEALATDHPGLKHFLGDHAFFELAEGYVQAYPSRSFSLNPLGRHLPEYIQQAAGVKRRAFAYDLARLERATTEAFDEQESPRLSEADIDSVGLDAWPSARLEPVAAFRLLAFRYPVGPWRDSIDTEGHDHPSTSRRDSYAAVYRREYSVYRLDLARAAHDLLADLAAGRTLGEAVEAGLRRGRPRPDADTLFRWFRQWVAAGVFARVHTAPPSS